MSSGVGVRSREKSATVVSRLPVIAWLLPLFIATADSSRLVPIGSESLTAYLTIAALGLLAIGPLDRRRAAPAPPPTPLGLKLWLLSAVVAAALLPRTDGTLQNVATYSVLILAAARTGAAVTPEHLPRLTSLTDKACWVFAAGYAFTLLTASQTDTGLFGTRTGAIVAVLALAWSATQLLALGGRARLNRLVLPLVLLGEIAASGSRTALAVAFGVVAIALIARRARSGGTVVVAMAGAAAFLYLAATWAPLRDRFLSGDSGIRVGGLTLNSEGRAGIWDELLAQWEFRPWLGHGIGHAQDVTLAASRGLIGQPHNDYLRVLVDQGVVGLGLLLAGLLSAFFSIWRRASRDVPEHRALHVSALAAVAAFAVFMVTDNPLVYVFVVAPTGVLIGASAGVARHVPRGKAAREPIRLAPGTVIGMCLFLAAVVAVALVQLWR